MATADNPAAIYYNPAGITQLDGQYFQAGLHALSANSEYHSPGGVRSDTKFEILPVPEFYYASKLKDTAWSLGLGVYAPYGLGLQWPENTSFRTLAIEGRLTYVTINPVIAWQADPTFSVAIGPTVNYSKTKLRNGIGFTPGDEFKFIGDDIDFGMTAGLLWKPCEQWALGASYRLPTSLNYGGSTVQSPYSPATSSSARIDFPQTIIAGISYRPTPNWNIEFDVDWTDWDIVNTLTFKNTATGDIPYPLNWKSSFLYEFGVSRYLPHGYCVSAGYFFSADSVTDKNFNPILPDANLHVGSLGFGHKGEHWDWAISGQIITGPSRTISNSQSTSLIGESADGRYHWFNQAVNVSLTYHF